MAGIDAECPKSPSDRVANGMRNRRTAASILAQLNESHDFANRYRVKASISCRAGGSHGAVVLEGEVVEQMGAKGPGRVEQ